jgi:hypothetical protein
VLENKSNLDYERNSELEKLAKSYHQQAAEWEVKYEEVGAWRFNKLTGQTLGILI